jgi:hypothetical protein
MRKTWRKLFRRTDGAVMVMGLFMGLFLVGCLWYMIGIGDSIVFHDRMQEVADSAAFSAAVVHARGMNFLVGINLVMMAMTGLYLVLAMVTDVSELIQMFVGHGKKGRIPIIGTCKFYDIEGPDCTFSYPICLMTFPCECYEDFAYLMMAVPYIGEVMAVIEPIICPLSKFNALIETGVADKAYPKYYDFMRDVMPVLELTQHGSSFVTPWVAEAVALTTGTQFNYGHGESGVTTPIIAGSMIPGAAADLLETVVDELTGKKMKPNKYTFNGTKLGLPVESFQFRAQCFQLAAYPFLVIEKLLGPIAQFPGIKQVFGLVIKTAATWVTDRWCDKPKNDKAAPETSVTALGVPTSFWHAEGPKAVYHAAKNAHDYMQVWAFVYDADAKDQSTNIVALASKQFLGKGVDQTTNHTFTSEAEYYFDCAAAWTDDTCNGTDVGWAMSKVHWRSRLRRVRRPTMVGQAGKSILDGWVGLGEKKLGGAIQNTGAFQDLTTKLQSIPKAKQGLVAGMNAGLKESGTLIENALGYKTFVSTYVAPDGTISTVIH